MASKQRSKRFLKKEKISTKPPIRTLKRSVRKQLERARAPNLWILPRIRDDAMVFGPHTYPRASLMGLPTELRQQILYETCDVKTLGEPDSEIIPSTSSSSLENHLIAMFKGVRGKELEALHPSTTSPSLEKNLIGMFKGVRGKELRAPHLNTRGRALLSLLGKKIGALCAICPTIREEMKFVGKRWHQELEVLLHGATGAGLGKLRTAKAGLLAERTRWLQSNRLGVKMPGEEKKMGTVEGKVRKVKGKKARPRKCWNCTERHRDGDPVCPAARKDPAKWMQLTKKVRGKKDYVGASSIFRGKKVVFSD